MSEPIKVEEISQDELIKTWNQANQQQKFWRDEELKFRTELVRRLYTKTKGTENVDIGYGWTLTISRSESYKLENGNNELDDVLKEFDEATADLLVKWEPKLDKRNFDKLTEEFQARFNTILTIKPDSPQVKLVPPKV